MRRSLFFVVLVAVVMTVSPVAHAVASTVGWERVDVTLHNEQSGGVILVQGTLPDSVGLPAQIELWAPEGSVLQWAGEILGGPASQDPGREVSKSTEGGHDVYRFTLEQSRQAQIEIMTGGDVSADGLEYSSSLVWTPAQDVPLVRLIVRVPQTAQVVRTSEGATMEPGGSGFSYYTKTFPDVRAGDPLELTFGYTVPAAQGAGAQRPSDSSSGLFVAIALAALAFLVLLFVMIGREVRAASSRRSSQQLSETGESAVLPGQEGPGVTDDLVEAEEGYGVDSEPHQDVTRPMKRNLFAGVVAAVLILTVFVVAGETSKPTTSADAISQTFSPGEPCLTATIPLDVPGGSDPKATAETIFEALRPVAGMNSATYRIETATLDVGFCESETSEAVIVQALESTGLVR